MDRRQERQSQTRKSHKLYGRGRSRRFARFGHYLRLCAIRQSSAKNVPMGKEERRKSLSVSWREQSEPSPSHLEPICHNISTSLYFFYQAMGLVRATCNVVTCHMAQNSWQNFSALCAGKILVASPWASSGGRARATWRAQKGPATKR